MKMRLGDKIGELRYFQNILNWDGKGRKGESTILMLKLVWEKWTSYMEDPQPDTAISSNDALFCMSAIVILFFKNAFLECW